MEICDKILRREDLLDQASASIEDHDVLYSVKQHHRAFNIHRSTRCIVVLIVEVQAPQILAAIEIIMGEVNSKSQRCSVGQTRDSAGEIQQDRVMD